MKRIWNIVLILILVAFFLAAVWLHFKLAVDAYDSMKRGQELSDSLRDGEKPEELDTEGESQLNGDEQPGTEE